MDDLQVKESLVSDATDAQRANGVLPTVVDNDRYIKGVLDRLEQKEKEKSPRIERPQTSKKPGAFERELERRCRQRGYEVPEGYSVTRREGAPLAMGGAPIVQRPQGQPSWEKRLRARIAMLRFYEDWRLKLESVNPLALQGQLGTEKQQEAENMVKNIINASNEKFGHWNKPKPKPLQFDLGK